MEIVIKKLSELTPYAKNPRKNADAVKYVAASIKEFGFKVPVIIDSAGEIVAGHTRVLAAKRLGLETVPCIVADDLTPEQVKAFRLADNKTAEMAEWDAELLSLELFNLKDFSMERFGFSSDDSDADVVEDDFDIDAATEEITEPKTALGDIWQLGRHRLMCGDSTLPGDVAALMDGACADMLLTDPPYNVAYEGTAGKIQNDSMKDGPFREFLTLAFKNAEDVMKPGAAFHIWHADSESYNFRGACRDAGLRIRQCLIWVKSSLVMGRQDFQWKHEPCLYGETPTPEPPDDEEAHEPCLYGWAAGKHYWFKNRKQTTVLQFDKPNKSKEHPTMKPVKLFDYQVKCNTKPGEIVLDLFGGSGTAIMACEQNNRVAYVMELDQKYADVIVARWEAFTGGKAVLING